MTRSLKLGLAAAIAIAGVSAPAQAQQFSDSFTFLKAVKERDGTKVEQLIAEPGSVVINSRGRGDGEGALHIVTRRRDLTWLNFLTSKGADADIQNEEGNTPLAIAAQLGWLEGADMLLRRGASVDHTNDRGETPLILAVQLRNLPMVRLLLGKGADPKHTDSVAGYSALDYAKRDQRADAILKLLEAPPKPAEEMVGPTL